MDVIRAMSCYSPPNVEAAPAPECREDRMVKIELEAAEALAGLAHSAVTENNGGDSVVIVNEPVKDDEMPPVHSQYESVSEPPNPSQDYGILQQKHHKKLHESISKPIKNEEFSEAELNGTCTTSYVSSGLGKSKQYLTEADKEARRIRRVLANRESARQTIRRRQAIFEELTRKAADLAWENENLKKEKELAVNEYDSLRNINETLKAQMTEVIKVGTEEIHPEITPCLAESSPLLFSNQPAFFPFLWPQLVQHPNSFQIQCGLQGSVVFPSPSPMLVRNDLEQSSYDKGNSMITNSPGTPLYLLPCPWIFPLPQQQSHSHQEQPFNLNDKPNEILLNTHYSPCSSAETVVHSESQHFLPVKVNTDTSISQETVPTSNIHNNLFGFPPDGGGQQQGGPRAIGNVLMPMPLRCVRSDINTEHEKNSQLLDVCEVKSIPAVASNIVSGVLEKSHESMAGKKVEDVTAAAEARKRRKELTKLKNLNCRQFRMHYLEKG